MKGVLEFNLPEEDEEFNNAQFGWKYKLVIQDMFNWLRSKSKYEDVTSVTIEEVREKLVDLEDKYNVKAYE